MSPLLLNANEVNDAPVAAENLRLLFVSHSLPPEHRPTANVGGMQRVASELHQALLRHPSLELSTVVLRSSSFWNAAATAYFLPKAYWTIHRMATRREIHAILFSSVLSSMVTILLHDKLQACGIRTFAIAHGNDVIEPVKIYQKLMPEVFASLSGVFPISEATRQACIERGARAERVRVVPNGIDIKRFDSVRTDSRSRESFLMKHDGASSLPLTDDQFLLCSVGRHVERKGFAWFIDKVMPQLAENVHYWIVGKGPQTNTIRQLIQHRGLERRVRLLGRVSDDDVEAVYRMADLMIMPNVALPGTMEGFGVVILEAGLCGTPTIGSRLEGIQDVIVDHENGQMVESGNVESFVRAIQHYQNDRVALERLSQRTVRFTQSFAWSNVVGRYVAAIQDAIK